MLLCSVSSIFVMFCCLLPESRMRGKRLKSCEPMSASWNMKKERKRWTGCGMRKRSSSLKKTGKRNQMNYWWWYQDCRMIIESSRLLWRSVKNKTSPKVCFIHDSVLPLQTLIHLSRLDLRICKLKKKIKSLEILRSFFKIHWSSLELGSCSPNYDHLIIFFPHPGPVRRDPNWDLFEKMRESNEKHREQLRVRDKEYQDKMGETESVIIFNNFQTGK